MSTVLPIRLPPPHPTSHHLRSTLLSAFAAAWRSQLFSGLPLCHLAMKQATASTRPPDTTSHSLVLGALGLKTMTQRYPIVLK